MRFAVVAALFCSLILGLGYTYSHESSAPAFLTAPVERGSIATLVKASGTGVTLKSPTLTVVEN